MSETEVVLNDRKQLAELRQMFKDDGLERLARSSYDYYSTHGDYVPALALLLLSEKAEFAARLAAVEAERDEANAAIASLSADWADLGLKLDRAEARVEAAEPFLALSLADREIAAIACDLYADDEALLETLPEDSAEALHRVSAVLSPVADTQQEQPQ